MKKAISYQFLFKKVFKENEGLFESYETTNYINPKYSIRLFDIPGRDYNDSDKMLKKILEN